jgi:hypothetical protein
MNNMSRRAKTLLTADGDPPLIRLKPTWWYWHYAAQAASDPR